MKDTYKAVEVPAPGVLQVVERCRAFEICLEPRGEPGNELDDWLQAERERQILKAL